jgi:hypothetical protein
VIINLFLKTAVPERQGFFMSLNGFYSMRNLFLIAALFAATAPFASAQTMLPKSFAGWSQSSAQTFSPAQNPSAQNESDGRVAAAAAKEYDFVSGEHAAYTRGPETLDVTLYKMTDPSGAYGEYSFLRTPDMPRGDLAEHSSMSPGRALALAGNTVLDIRGNNLPKLDADLKALVNAVDKSAQQGPLPWIGSRLPADDLIPRTDHYILGPVALNRFFPLGDDDWLGFSHGAEAETAQYKLGGKTVTLLLADFPTPQIASDELSRLGRRFNVNGSKSGPAGPLFAKRTVTMLEIVMGASTQAEAGSLLGQIESGTQVTWNEPTFQFKEPSIEMMIVGSIIGTGVICGFTLIAGLAFGGVRLVVKRAFPNKVFDRSSQIQVLQLGLSSKPINAEDFYQSDGTVIEEITVDKDLPDRVALRIFR